MIVNESQSKNDTFFNRTLKYLSQQNTSEKIPLSETDTKNSTLHIQNPYRKRKVILSIVIVILSTLWVQITMQRYAPFVRAAQCYFNQIILEHYSQDIYEGTDVIYWKTGEYYNYQDILAVFDRLNKTIVELDTNSLFQIQKQYLQTQSDVNILVKYGDSHLQQLITIVTFNSSLGGFSQLMQSTFLNRTFYEHLWQVQTTIKVPIIYRQKASFLNMKIQSELFSSIMMNVKINVDLVDGEDDIIKDQEYSDQNLGIRKRHDSYDMNLTVPYLFWIILALYLMVFTFQFKFIALRNQAVTKKLRINIVQEKNLQKLLSQFNKQQKSQQNVNNSSNQSNEEEEKIDLSDNYFPIPEKYQLTLEERIKKIGPYYVAQIVLSFVALLSYYNDHNGLICFFSWVKLMIYLSQTRNKFMLGFLLEQTIPIYIKILLNILLIVTSFVLFNMVVYPTTIKFETLKLGYFEYIFNYFQYGIYENFILAFQQYGLFAQFFYFLQLMILLYIGNNILMSIMANQVMKNSYLETVVDMLKEIKTQCPACGANPKEQKQDHSEFFSRIGKRKSAFISKIISKNNLDSRYDSQVRQSSEYQIVVNSPMLSPFFPSKNQKQQKERYMSPKLKNGNFQKHLKQINKRLQQQEISSQSKIESVESLNKKANKKKIKVEISESKIEHDSQSKYRKRIRSKIDLLFQKIQNFREIQKDMHTKSPNIGQVRYYEIKEQTLNQLLSRVEEIKVKCNEKVK